MPECHAQFPFLTLPLQKVLDVGTGTGKLAISCLTVVMGLTAHALIGLWAMYVLYLSATVILAY